MQGIRSEADLSKGKTRPARHRPRAPHGARPVKAITALLALLIVSSSASAQSEAERTAMQLYKASLLEAGRRLEPSGEALAFVADVAANQCIAEQNALAEIAAPRMIEQEAAPGFPKLSLGDAQMIIRDVAEQYLVEQLMQVRADRLSTN
jgi:hypothetical protein